MKENGKWLVKKVLSVNYYETDWSGCEESFNTKEQAIAWGKKHLKSSPFKVGQVDRMGVPNPIDIDNLLEQVEADIDSNGGSEYDAGENFYYSTTKEQKEEVENALKKVWADWVEKYNLTVSFFNIINIETIQ